MSAGAIAATPEPPYYAVIFTSVRSGQDQDGYEHTAAEMMALAASQPGYLGVESVSADIGVTISYWKDLPSIASWRRNAEHQLARRAGRERWYQSFVTRIALVERDYSFVRE